LSNFKQKYEFDDLAEVSTNSNHFESFEAVHIITRLKRQVSAFLNCDEEYKNKAMELAQLTKSIDHPHISKLLEVYE